MARTVSMALGLLLAVALCMLLAYSIQTYMPVTLGLANPAIDSPIIDTVRADITHAATMYALEVRQ